MEALIASAVGLMTAAGIYLILRLRTFPVIVGLSMLTYAVNVFIFASGRLTVGLPPILDKTAAGYTDPLTQALVLTAIVISFGMTAVIVMMGLGAFLSTGSDRIDDAPADRTEHGGRAE
jgi:multicomponent K+:H+ antiporter subunit C